MKVKTTDIFDDWLLHLKDRQASTKITARLELLAGGYFGDSHSVGDGVSEMRINTGPGYRLYYTLRENKTITILLCGGDKNSQQRDIEKAQELAKEQ